MSGPLQLIERNALDEHKWDKLVIQTAATVYNQRYYLDTLAENWCAVVWGDYQGAMAIPYSVRLGVKGIFTPNFIRSLDWMGEKPIDFSKVEALLRKQFRRGNLNTNESLFSKSSEQIYQAIDTEQEIQIGSQTKRSTKKFEKTGLLIEPVSIEEALPVVISELKAKVKSLTPVDFKRFEQLLLNYDRKQCSCYGIRGEELHAAIILIERNKHVLHIKSGVDEFGKQNGLMHALMYEVIRKAVANEKKFSFEGSFVPSVRQFNVGFGATDRVYYNWKWDNSPWWFNMLLKLKKS